MFLMWYDGDRKKSAGDKIGEADRQRVEEKVAELRKAVASEDVAAIRSAFSAVESESHQIAEQLYKSTSEQSEDEPRETANVGASTNEDVIDAEFKEEK